jgi:hypothetical protein
MQKILVHLNTSSKIQDAKTLHPKDLVPKLYTQMEELNMPLIFMYGGPMRRREVERSSCLRGRINEELTHRGKK